MVRDMNNKKKEKKTVAERLWLIIGSFIVLFSFIFLVPPIYMALSGNILLGAYINSYFIPFLFTLLLIFIILVVVYIWWHMSNQTDLVLRLDRIEGSLEALKNSADSNAHVE
jgi:sterol desaturase/sphingolipid hydroxylase (fatty acid hydroxylase superfamily)